MRKNKLWASLAGVALISTAIAVAPAASARNTPVAPNVSTNSSISFTQSASIDTDDGLDFVYPEFDLTGQDVVVNIDQYVGTQTITTVNLKLPSGFVVEGFDSMSTSIQSTGDTICGTTNMTVSYDSSGVTAKGFTCLALDQTVEFTFTVSGVYGYVTQTTAGDYYFESQFRTAATRKNKDTAYVVEDSDAITLSTPEV